LLHIAVTGKAFAENVFLFSPVRRTGNSDYRFTCARNVSSTARSKESAFCGAFLRWSTT
jgi:hypothetical protein